MGAPVRILPGACRDAAVADPLGWLMERPAFQDACAGFPGPSGEAPDAWGACSRGGGWSDTVLTAQAGLGDAFADRGRQPFAALVSGIRTPSSAGFTFFIG